MINTKMIKSKQIHDPLYGSIRLTQIATAFVDNRFFQRLRRLKQLGVCDAVFPSATHTRFEHSIGTYHLAGLQLEEIRLNSDWEHLHHTLGCIDELAEYFKENKKIELDQMIIEMVKIGALCHDIGHGPFSHIFDDHFIRNSHLTDHPNATHEDRSSLIIRLIVKESKYLNAIITDMMIRFIQNIVNPKKEHTGWIYQVVSNSLNSLDVDKYDYITRDCYHLGINTSFDYRRLIDGCIVINNVICYPEQSVQDIYNLFATRHNLHRKAYGHKASIAFQYLITDLMSVLDHPLGITDSIKDMDRFVRMSDQYVIQMMENIILNPTMYNNMITSNELIRLQELSTMYNTHTLYPHIGTLSTLIPCDIMDEYFTAPQYIVFKNKIGFVSGNKLNPLDNIYVYKTKDQLNTDRKLNAIHIDKKDVTHLIPSYYQECLTMIFRRDCYKSKTPEETDREMFKKIKEKYNIF